MGKVYRAHDPILDRHVALKTVAPALLTSKDTLARFRREARAAARLQHPNIVTIFELGEVEGTHYIAMELVEGIELGEAMSPIDRFTLEQKVRMVVDVCRGLDFAHKMGVVHRDVKPANIRLTRDGTVKILDFGIAQVAARHRLDRPEPDPGGHGARHPELPVAGAAAGRQGRPPRRHVGGGRDPLRDARRPPARSRRPPSRA